MSKTIYLIELFKDPTSSSKFKFAIENSKKMVKQLKEEIRQKLIQKGELLNTDEITIKDEQDFELCSDDDIEDVLPDTQKTMRVSLKGMAKSVTAISQSPSVQLASLSSTSASVVQSPSILSQVGNINISQPQKFGVNEKVLLVDAFIKPGRIVKPYEIAMVDENHIQLRLRCPQLQNCETEFGIILPKTLSYWELSREILIFFGLQSSNLKALLFNSGGAPMIWSTDYMGLMAQNLNPSETYTVLFTLNSSTYETPVLSPDIYEQKNNIFVKINNGSAVPILVNLQLCTIDNLRRKIYQKFRIHPRNQLIKFGLKISDHQLQTLKEFGIVETSLIDVSYKARHHVASITYNDNFYTQGLQHVFKQTIQGVRRLRSNLLITTYHLPQNIHSKFLALVRKFTKGNTALVTALKTLLDKKKVCEVQKIAIQEGLFCMFRDFMIRCRDFPKHYQSQDVFLATRQCLGFFLSAAKDLKNSSDFDQAQTYNIFSSSCPFTSERIIEPIYLTLDDKTRIITDKQVVLNRIKNNLSFTGIAKLNESLISSSKDLQSVYDNFKRNLTLYPSVNFDIVEWKANNQQIDILKTFLDSLILANPYTYYGNHMENVSPDLKVFNCLQLRTKCQYQYLLKDKNDEEKIYVGKSKDVNLPHNIFDVITGGEVGVNFNIMGGATGSQNVDIVVTGKIDAVITKEPAEAIVVLLDISGSMGGKFFNQPDLIRIGAVKSFFQAFAYRTMAYNFEHVISLILFDNVAEMKVDFTESFQDFNLLVANAKPRGSTLLFDAISSASDNLIKLKNKYPNVILRILALTDGEDTGSVVTIQNAVSKLVKNKIVVDSFVVGSNCEGLKALTFAAGGRCYLTRNIEESLKLFEQETVLSCRSRKQEDKVDSSNIHQLVQRMKLRPFTFTSNVYEFKVPEMSKPNISAGKLVSQLNDPAKLEKVAPTSSLKRVAKELQAYQKQPHPFVTVFPCPQLNMWKILLYGPKETPYEGGLFLLYIKFPNDYPFRAPQLRFITPIYHCNMNSQGRICHSIFDRNYSPAVTFKNMIDAVYGLILTPEPDDPLDSVIASFFLSEYPKYFKNAQESTKANANKSVEEIIQQVFGNIADDNERQQKIKDLKEWVAKAQTYN